MTTKPRFGKSIFTVETPVGEELVELRIWRISIGFWRKIRPSEEGEKDSKNKVKSNKNVD